jgi:flagellar biosynthetic protein FliP
MMSSSSRLTKLFTIGMALGLGMSANPRTVSAVGLTLDLGTTSAQQTGTSLQLLMLMTVLSLAPAILMLMTSFTRIIIVLSFVRNALGTQQLPPNQVMVGLALFLTFFVMAPTWTQINTNAVQPYMKNQITQTEALAKAEEPLRNFMFRQTREKDLELFVGLSKMERPKTYRDVPTHVLIPAFVISELKTAFQMGFAIFIPFIVIDMIVSSTLMSIGMMMLPPMMISLPFKLLLFVLVDGWHLVVESLVTSFK